ncbi:GNAT family N-acetyltransferase [Paenibacillus sp. N3.4]|nr:GNAT family N-acetyltransferase [Paenibacillus sp. N3.4]
MLVAESAGEIKGFANFFPSKQNIEEAELAAIYILPEVQSQGLGGKLLSKGIQELGGLKTLFGVVEKENRIGRRFYESKGFKYVNEFVEKLQGHVFKSIKWYLRLHDGIRI